MKSAGDNVLYGTAQGIPLVLVRGTDEFFTKVNFPVVLVPELKRDLFGSVAIAQNIYRDCHY